QLERVGGHYAAHRAFAQAFLDLSAPQRQVPAPVAADAFGLARSWLEVVFQIGGQDFRGQPALREHDDLKVALEEFGSNSSRPAQIRAADSELTVYDRRIDEREELLAARRAAAVDQ